MAYQENSSRFSYKTGTTVGRVMDMETRINKELVRDILQPNVSDLDEAVMLAKAHSMAETGSDFLPLIFHIPVAIAIARFKPNGSGVIELTGGPTCIPVMHPETGDNVPHTHPEYSDFLVKQFWNYCELWDGSLVSYNGRGFDFPVLELNALRLGLKIPKYFEDSKNSFRHRYGRHIDLMDLLSNHGAVRRIGKLDWVLKMLGLPGKGEVSGGDVDRLWDEGKFEEIERYCIDDTMQTFELLRKVETIRGYSGIAG